MRTSIDIPDGLLARARRLMKRKGVTLRELVIAGLARLLDESEREQSRFVLRDASWDGPQGYARGATAEDLPRMLRDMNDEWRRQGGQ